MKEKLLTRIQALSLFVLGLSGLTLSVSGIAGITMPDALIRTIGILELIAVGTQVYALVRLRILREQRDGEEPENRESKDVQR